MDSFDYEKAIIRLQEIVDGLESGKLSLEESMKLYEEGIRLTSACYETLRNAEQKITELSENEEVEE